MEEEKTKIKGKMLKIILPIVILVLLVTAGVGGYFVYQNIQYNKPIETEWGQKYFEYIEAKVEDKDYQFLKDANGGTIKFVQLEEKDEPIMALEYKDSSSNSKGASAFYIKEDGDVSGTTWTANDNIESSKIVYLYNLDMKQYRWYYECIDKNGGKSYSDLISQLNYIDIAQKYNYDTQKVMADEEGKKAQDELNKSVYTFNNEQSGDKTFETTFIKPESVDVKEIEIESFDGLKELKDNFREATAEYKTNSEIITTETQESVNKKVAEYEEAKRKAEEERKAAEEAARKAEEMKITQSNMIEKVGEHLKYFSGCYLGRTYGIGTIYKLTDVTGKVNVPGTHSEYEMSYEVVGLSSISSLNATFKKYIADDVVSKLKRSDDGDITADLHDYNGKVYWVRGGIGDGPAINYKKAKVLSSEGDTTKIQLENINLLGDIVTERITVTVKYDETTSTFKITDYSVNRVN